MIKNIIFDMGAVMMDFNPRAFVDRLELPEEDKVWLMNGVFRNRNWALLDYGVFTEEEALEHMKKDIPERLWAYAEHLVKDWDKPILPIEGMADLVRRLKEAGYGIWLLSNAGPRHDEYWPHVPGSEYFDGKVVSAYIHMYKPQTEIYEYSLKTFGLKAEECIFVDDQNTNCAAAWMCGIDSIVFRGKKELEYELARRGIRY